MMEDDLPRSRCKVYVHHPDKLEWPIEGNDVPFLCLSCNHMFNVDSEKPRTTCTKCRSSEIVDCCGLGGRACHGIFEIDKGSWKISCVAWDPMIAVFRDAVSGQCYLILPSSKCVMACMAPNHGQNIAKKKT